MFKEYACVESVVNLVIGKPVAVLVCAILVGSRWTVKRITSVLNRVRCTACTKPASVLRR